MIVGQLKLPGDGKNEGDDGMKLNSGNLSNLLTWHHVSKVGDMNKDKKLTEWLRTA